VKNVVVVVVIVVAVVVANANVVRALKVMYLMLLQYRQVLLQALL
jgi:hypothetical protein